MSRRPRPRPRSGALRAEQQRTHDLAARTDHLRHAAPGPHARAALVDFALRSFIR